ncbi:MAG TPA: hypothetical protein VNM37_19500, partial [Candidatus Dormibacteraeota bacterium]|nr:hypothetical protein [Candidatus Dormibacteraeota bacterium]
LPSRGIVQLCAGEDATVYLVPPGQEDFAVGQERGRRALTRSEQRACPDGSLWRTGLKPPW